jgi:hypothetical protein
MELHGQFLKIYENGTQSPYPFYTQHNVTIAHVDNKHMRFHVVLTNLEMHIFTMPPKFHGLAIGNHDLKIINDTYIAISLLGDATMNKIMVASTINKNDDLPMVNVTN